MDRPWAKRVSKCFLIPQRYIMVIMTSFGLFNAFTMRTALQVALFGAIQRGNITVFHHDTCPNPKGAAARIPKFSYRWSGENQDYIQSSFYWGYILTQIPAGIVAEFYGAKYVALAGVLASSIITLLTPWAIRASQGKFGVMLTLRLFLGLAQGTLYPAANAILAQWVPKRERSRMASIVYSGEQLGIFSALCVGGEVIRANWTWSWIFNLCGLVGITWCVFWQLLCFSSPQTHLFISDGEKEYLRNELKGVDFKKKGVPWQDIIKSPHVWSAIGAEFGHSWAYLIILAEMPKYMKNILKMDALQIAMMSSIPFLFMWLMSIIAGFICDFVINRNCLSLTRTRKIFTTIGFTGSGLFMIFAAAARCDHTIFVAMFVISLSLMATYNPGTKTVSLDLAPNWSAILVGLITSSGILVGILTPVITVFTTPHQTFFQWNNAFWVSFLILVFTNILFVVFLNAEEEAWNNKRTEESSDLVETAPEVQ